MRFARVIISHYFNWMAESLFDCLPDEPTWLIHVNKPALLSNFFRKPKYALQGEALVENAASHGAVLDRILVNREFGIFESVDAILFVDHDAWFTRDQYRCCRDQLLGAIEKGKKLAAYRYNRWVHFHTKPMFAVSTAMTWPSWLHRSEAGILTHDTGQYMAQSMKENQSWESISSILKSPECLLVDLKHIDWSCRWRIWKHGDPINHYIAFLDRIPVKCRIGAIERDRVLAFPLFQELQSRLEID